MDLTDPQWTLLEPLIPEPPKREDGKGRPRRKSRDVLNGILWVLRTGAASWKDMPSRYPPYQTCHRRFQEWVWDGHMERVLMAVAEDLRERGGLDLGEAFIDGSFARAKKGGLASVLQRSGKGPRSWPLQTAMVFLSPFAWKVLRRMRRSSLTSSSTPASSTKTPKGIRQQAEQSLTTKLLSSSNTTSTSYPPPKVPRPPTGTGAARWARFERR